MQYNIRSVCKIRYVLLFSFNLPIFMENVNMRLVHFSRRYWWHRFSLINDSKTHKSFYRDNLTCSWKKILLWKRANYFIYLKLTIHTTEIHLISKKTVIISLWRFGQGKLNIVQWTTLVRYILIDSFEFYILSSKTLK